MRSSPSPPNSTGGTIDSDSGEPRFGDVPSSACLLAKSRKSFSQVKRYSSFYQWAKPNSLLGDRKKAEKIRKKRKLVRREVPAPPTEEEYREEEAYTETAMSPLSEGDAQSSGERCSAWDSDTPSNASYPPTAPEEQGLIQMVGKRTIIRQGKQVVFRDEDGSGDDEDIMVDSGMNREGEQGAAVAIHKGVGSGEEYLPMLRVPSLKSHWLQS